MKIAKVFGWIKLVFAVFLLAFIIINEIGAVRDMAGKYAALMGQKISAEEATTITYDDKAAAVVI